MDSIDSEFLQLREHFFIIFEHDTDVPGLADSLKHLEGFYNLCDMLGVAFLKRRFKTSRSAMADCDNPAELIGIDRLIEDLSADAKLVLSGKSNKSIPVNFNYLVSGTERAHEGSHKVVKLSIEEKASILSRRICAELLKRYEVSTVSELVAVLKPQGIEAIRFAFSVHHISIISQFIPAESRLKSYFSQFARQQFSGTDDADEKHVVITAHLRRGDTAVFSTPSGKLVSAWGNWRNPKSVSSDPEILEDISKAAYVQYDFQDFLVVISAAIDAAKKVGKTPKVNFLSDGFGRGFARIQEHADRLQLSSDDLAHIREWVKLEEQMYRHKLVKLSEEKDIDVNMFIGENKSSFVDSVTSIAKSDILVAGVGGFSRTIFDKFGFKERKLLIKDVTPTSSENLIEKIDKFFQSL